MPDWKFMIRMSNQRAGSKNPDLGGIIMSWQVGHDRFQVLMRRKDLRMKAAMEFSKDERHHYTIRAIVGETLCKPKQLASIEMISKIYKRFLSETSPGG